MADDTEKAAISADELKILYDYHVDEVSVDALEVTDQEYQHIMQGWGIPGEDPISEEDRQKARTSATSVASSRMAAADSATEASARLAKVITKIRTKAVPRGAGGIFRKAADLPSAAVRFVLYSGLTRNNALVVTFRAIVLMAPILFAACMMYWVAASILPGGGSTAKGARSPLESMDAPFAVSKPAFAVSFPDGFDAVNTEAFFRDTPLAREAASRDRQRLVSAAVSREKPGYFASTATGYGLAANAKTGEDFSRNLGDYINEKEVAATMMQGAEQGVPPYDPTEHSVSYGLALKRGGHSLRLYSCLVYANGQSLILNVGYSLPDADVDAADAEWCQKVLADWRDAIVSNN